MSKTRVFNQGFDYFIEVTFVEPESPNNQIWTIYQYILHDGERVLFGIINAYNKVTADYELYRTIEGLWTQDECEWVEEAEAWVPKSELNELAKERECLSSVSQ